MTRRGKIARQSHTIRTTLNQRLRDGEPGPSLLDWLNHLPAVQEVLAAQFGGLPVSEQNLSEWRQGGYQDWLAQQDTVDAVAHLSEQAADLQKAAGKGQIFSDHLSLLLTAELGRATQALLTGRDYPGDRWQRLRAMAGLLNQLRRGDHQAARIQMESERWFEEYQELEAVRRGKARDAIFHLKTLKILIEQQRARRRKRAQPTEPPVPPTDDSSRMTPSPAGSTDNCSLITPPPAPAGSTDNCSLITPSPASRDQRTNPDVSPGSPSPGGEGRGEGGIIPLTPTASPDSSGQNRVAQT